MNKGTCNACLQVAGVGVVEKGVALSSKWGMYPHQCHCTLWLSADILIFSLACHTLVPSTAMLHRMELNNYEPTFQYHSASLHKKYLNIS